MCRLGQVHVSRAHARPCWTTRSPNSMPCEWGRSDLDDLWEIEQQQIRPDDMFFFVLGANEPLLKRSNRGGTACHGAEVSSSQG